MTIAIDPDSGLLSPAYYVPSPNFSPRPPGSAIDLLVIHGISLPPGEFGGTAIVELFTNCLDPTTHPYFEEIKNLRVSSHLLIRRDGQIIQFVPFIYSAWHAGVSEFCGRTHCNEFSVGIELEGTDTLPYVEVQYYRLAEVARELMRVYPAITKQRMVGHSDIAPGRKTDPGPAFKWDYFYNLLTKL